MRILLDTSVLIWATGDDNRLSQAARTAIVDPANERLVSVASLWEMQIKHSSGKLELPGDLDRLAPVWLRLLGASALPIELAHLASLYVLPRLHGDPFDRMILAQAVAEGLTIITPDRMMRRYDVPTLW